MARSKCFNGLATSSTDLIVNKLTSRQAMDDWDKIIPLLQRIRVDV